jgi:hypothetical protein
LSGDLLGGEVFPESETTFFSPLLADNLRITFVRNKKNKATRIVLQLKGSVICTGRVPDRPAKSVNPDRKE